MQMPSPFAGALERVFEIVQTDVLVWEAARAPRPARARVDVEVIELTSRADVERVAPRAKHAHAEPFLRRGDVGFAAVAEGRFAGWIWVSRTSHRDPWSGLPIRLAADEAYAYALYIDPEFRPAGVARVLMVAMLTSIHADPALTRVYGWADRGNRESQMLLRLLGFKDVQSVRRLMLLDRRGRPLPRGASPAYGPMSRSGRHREPAAPDPIHPIPQGDHP